MNDIVAEGLSLLVFGMGFVLVFLTLLVIATSTMSRIMMRIEPAPTPASIKPNQGTASASQPNDQVLVAVMSAAIKKYRADRHDK